jgi:hypothetical protein
VGSAAGKTGRSARVGQSARARAIPVNGVVPTPSIIHGTGDGRMIRRRGAIVGVIRRGSTVVGLIGRGDTWIRVIRRRPSGGMVGGRAAGVRMIRGRPIVRSLRAPTRVAGRP